MSALYEAIPYSLSRFKQVDHALVTFLFLELIAIFSIAVASTRNRVLKMFNDKYYCCILEKMQNNTDLYKVKTE